MASITWEDEPLHKVFLSDEPPLDALACLVAVASGRSVVRGPVQYRAEAMPAPEQADAWLLDTRTGKDSDFVRHAKATLPKASVYYPPLFDPARTFSADKGGRYTKLRSAVAWASGHLVGSDDQIQPGAIYALFRKQIEQWGDDDDGTPFVERLWIFVEHFYSLDEAQIKERQRTAQVAARDAAGIMDGMIAGVKRWFPEIEHMEQKEQRKWLLRHLIVSVSGSRLYYVMDTEGEYSPNGISTQQMIATLINQGTGRIIRLKNEEGKHRQPQEILNEYSYSVKGIRYVVGSTHSSIDRVDTAQATLCFGAYARRTDLEPTWSDEVDAWLRALAGTRYETLCEWIGHALAFDEGALPMLSICGPPDIGKKLLVMGLAECLVEPATADGAALFGNWSDRLLLSPYVWLDEGDDITSYENPADRLRQAIGAPEMMVKIRFKDTVALRTNVRVIITSNELDAVSKLGLGRELSADAQSAIAERVIHMNGRIEAAALLARRGGMSYTGRPGARWIRGDGQEPSNHIIAKHFLKLHEMTAEDRVSRTGRFLMSGLSPESYDPAIMANLRTAGPDAQAVVTCLFRMLNSLPSIKGQGTRLDKLWIDDESRNIFVLAGGIHEFMQADSSRTKNVPSVKSIAKTLDNISKPILIRGNLENKITACSQGRYRLLSRAKAGKQAWRALDVDVLAELSLQWQCPCPILDQIAGMEPLPDEAHDDGKVIQFPRAADEPPEPPLEATA